MPKHSVIDATMRHCYKLDLIPKGLRVKNPLSYQSSPAAANICRQASAKLRNVALSLSYNKQRKLNETISNNDWKRNIHPQSQQEAVQHFFKEAYSSHLLHKRDWTSNANRNRYIDCFTDSVEQHLRDFLNEVNHLSGSKIDNLSSQERQALRELRSKENIVIKPVDKGGAIVLQNREDYISEEHRQLADNSFFFSAIFRPNIRSYEEASFSFAKL
ncbi:hypothetical protein HOLleu_35605 [Holothuria leucospilota]|uniref:Uncharacterized protein n=1 Tax=Holothuria leucospilota TaxID=206669 RepID=A0A9Q0YIP3_HOLLE|nr:hypothetical protein HOLleu_35605 [Holothuria leucospilota]